MDRPIIFSAPMVRALLAGTKTQTRRIIKPQPEFLRHHLPVRPEPREGRRWVFMCRTDFPSYSWATADFKVLYAPGDRLWVREAFCLVPRTAYQRSEGVQQTVCPTDTDDAAIYRAGWDRSGKKVWRPSIHMPRWAARLTLTVTDVRVQRLQDISEHDAIAEGVDPVVDHGTGNPHLHKIAFEHLWNHLHGPNAWLANPWIVALTFTVARRNIDAPEDET